MTPAEIVLVRHGETEWSRDGRHTGRTDIPLTEAGRAQAGQLAEPLSEWRFARVLSSPLQRALETCRLAGLGDGVDTTDDLLEWDYGEYEGVTTLQIRETRPGWYLWRDGCPGGETAAQVGARVDRVVAALRPLDADGLQVGVEAAARAVVRVRDVVAELRPLAADFASFSHDV